MAHGGCCRTSVTVFISVFSAFVVLCLIAFITWRWMAYNREKWGAEAGTKMYDPEKQAKPQGGQLAHTFIVVDNPGYQQVRGVAADSGDDDADDGPIGMVPQVYDGTRRGNISLHNNSTSTASYNQFFSPATSIQSTSSARNSSSINQLFTSATSVQSTFSARNSPGSLNIIASGDRQASRARSEVETSLGSFHSAEEGDIPAQWQCSIQ